MISIKASMSMLMGGFLLLVVESVEKVGERKKSAKDIAFEKERCQYKKIIRELDQCLSKTKAETDDLRQHIASLEIENATLQDWVDRLLEYTELSEEDFRSIERDFRLMVEFNKNMKKAEQLWNSIEI